jgi:hypothetical protein
LSIGATLLLVDALTNFPVSHRKSFPHSQCCSFAGKPIVVQSNSIAILNHAVDFFGLRSGGARLPDTVPVITLAMNDLHGREYQDAPWFRGRGYFALARFTSADIVWFNLRARTVHGVFSPQVISDPDRWSKHILPVIAGILAPVISVVPIHAACLATGISGVLLAGPSGTGKSTLAITLARLGYRFLADEWTYLAEGNGEIQAWSLPVPVKLLPDAITYFPELSSYRCARSLNGELAYEVSPHECFTLSRATNCRVKCIVLLERSAKRGCRIEQVSAAKTISQLTADIEPLTGQLRHAYRQQLALLSRLSNVECTRVLFNGPPLQVARVLDRALNHTFDRNSSDRGRISRRSEPDLLTPV